MTAYRRTVQGAAALTTGVVMAFALVGCSADNADNAAPPAAAAGGAAPSAVASPAPTSTPAVSRTVAADVVTVDPNGRSVPPPAAAAARGLAAALAGNDVAAVQRLYQPRPSAAPWSEVLPEVQKPVVRTAIGQTLRTPPTVRPDGSSSYAYGNYAVEMSPDGAVTSIGPP